MVNGKFKDGRFFEWLYPCWKSWNRGAISPFD